MTIQNVVFRCEYLFYYSAEMNDNDRTFSLAPLRCSSRILTKITRKTIKIRAEKGDFACFRNYGPV